MRPLVRFLLRLSARGAGAVFVCPLSAFAVGAVGAVGAACSSNGDAVTCGEGTVLSGHTCIVTEADASTDAHAPIGDGAARDGDSSPGDSSAPGAITFAGVSAVAPASPASLLVTWAEAHDTLTPPARMKYLVFVGPSGSPLDYGKPLATTLAGATSFFVEQLDATKTYAVAVRALDEAGNSDANLAVKMAAPAGDTAAPTFNGVKTAAPAGAGAVALTWDAAQDNLTPAAAIVYYVYVATPSAAFDFSLPTLVTEPGVTSATVSDLYDGTQAYKFLVRARDAADNIDGNSATATAHAGADTTPPQFAGCKTAIADSAGSAVLSWDLATDDTTPQSLVAYDVYASSTEGGYDFKAPPAATIIGAASAHVGNLTPHTTWHFVCRARDFSGNEDDNLVDRAATTLTDDMPPTFAGLTGGQVDSSARTVLLSWSPASDDQTPPAQIVYDVFQGSSPGLESYKTPIASSTAGAASVLVTDLTPDTTLYWVVRARDLAGNHDSNTVETSGIVNVSFSRQVQVTFSQYCAVTGCHVPGNPVAGLILAPGFAYSYLANVKSREYPSEFRVNPNNPTTSFLYQKVSMNPPPVGWQMPAPATGSVLNPSEKDVIRRWIAQGAVDN